VRRPAWVLVFACLFLLSGCGAELAVRTEVDYDLSGRRVYTISVSSSDLETAGLTPGQLLQVLKEDCPREAGAEVSLLERSKDWSSYVFEIRQPFSDPEDLAARAGALSGGKARPVLSRSGPPLAPVYTFSDGEPEDYFAWAKAALDRRGLAREHRNSWVEEACGVVVFPDGRERPVSPGTSLEFRADLPARQDLLVRWDPLTGRSELDLMVDLSPAAAKAVAGEDMLRFLQEALPGSSWETSDLPDGGRRYRTVVPLGRNFALAGGHGPTRGLAFRREVKPAAGGLALDSRLEVEGDCASWLGTSDLASTFRLCTGYLTGLALPEGGPAAELVGRQASLRHDTGPLDFAVEARYPNPVAPAVVVAAAALCDYLVRRKRRNRPCSGGSPSSS
jgi:hypothetical protein